MAGRLSVEYHQQAPGRANANVNGTTAENDLRREHGLPPRLTYGAVQTELPAKLAW